MEMQSNVQERPEVAADERAMHERVKRILKLRWMGMEDKGERMQSALQRAKPGVTSLAGPYDTISSL